MALSSDNEEDNEQAKKIYAENHRLSIRDTSKKNKGPPKKLKKLKKKLKKS